MTIGWLQPWPQQVAQQVDHLLAGTGELIGVLDGLHDQRSCFLHQDVGVSFHGCCGCTHVLHVLGDARHRLPHHRCRGCDFLFHGFGQLACGGKSGGNVTVGLGEFCRVAQREAQLLLCGSELVEQPVLRSEVSGR